MTEDEIQDDYAYKVAIASVIYNIENRNDLSDISKVYIDWISEYIQRVNKTLDSILDESYIFTPHFVEVVRALANKKDLFKDEISKHKEEFNLINSKLDKLKTNPKEFSYQGLKVTVHVFLYTPDRQFLAEKYRPYWFDNIEQVLKQII